MVANDGKDREMVVLPLKLLNGWMFGVSENRVAEHIKPTLIKYKRECYDALHRHFQPQPQITYGKLAFPAMRAEFEDLLQDALRLGYTRTEALQRANKAYVELTGLDLGRLIGFPDFSLASTETFLTLPQIVDKAGLEYTATKPWMVRALQNLGLLSEDKKLTPRGEWHCYNRSTRLEELMWDTYVEEDLLNSAQIRTSDAKSLK